MLASFFQLVYELDYGTNRLQILFEQRHGIEIPRLDLLFAQVQELEERRGIDAESAAGLFDDVPFADFRLDAGEQQGVAE